MGFIFYAEKNKHKIVKHDKDIYIYIFFAYSTARDKLSISNRDTFLISSMSSNFNFRVQGLSVFLSEFFWVIDTRLLQIVGGYQWGRF